MLAIGGPSPPRLKKFPLTSKGELSTYGADVIGMRNFQQFAIAASTAAWTAAVASPATGPYICGVIMPSYGVTERSSSKRRERRLVHDRHNPIVFGEMVGRPHRGFRDAGEHSDVFIATGKRAAHNDHVHFSSP